MKTTEPKKNQKTKFSKYQLIFLLSILFTLHINAKINIDLDTLNNRLSVEKYKLEKALFTQVEDLNTENLKINDFEVIELEEEVELGFDTSQHLPKNFNALKGKNDIDWNTIEVIELEEEVELGFDTSKHLPKNFNALKGKNDLDWSTIKLIEIEEEIEINFDVKTHLPANFNPYVGLVKNDVIITSIN
ncbi:MAG: hypothetical protein DA407_01450 [Bacteroidetes bacterium]|nr:MAG: hypothetical protein DA407_01450 [Bacteroidota bacterium]